MQVVIVGGGVLGLGCAAALTQRAGVDVTVVDRGNPGEGSTGLAVGMAVRFQTDPVSFGLMNRSYAILEDLHRVHGLPLRRIGHLAPGRTPTQLASFERVRKQQLELGLPPSEVIDRAELGRVVPDYAPPADVTGAAWDPHAFFVDGTELCGILAATVRDRGGKVLRATELLSAHEASGSGFVIRTTTGELRADVIVNAAGAWSGVVGDRLGAPVGVLNERHEAYIFSVKGARGPLPMMLDFLPGASEDEGLYFRAEGADRLVAGLHSSRLLGEPENDTEGYSQRLTDSAVETVFGQLTEVLPELELGYVGGWAGLYPHHPADRFILGEHPDRPGVFAGVGLGGRGLGPGVALGEALAEWIVEGKPTTIPEVVGLAPGSDLTVGAHG
ncbi:NAD(P)/FAD-dependent oxidoreductase [Marmoricola sp. RAF53]|uniref:NAD(P)/FAD-dependent oxidoreductase n=1 Tax=Marmoricola sp. RAF53 TaxID=3233059 RepID=UPI003F96599F